MAAATLPRRAMLGALALPLVPLPLVVNADPVFAAIETLRTAERALMAALSNLDENDAVQMARADAAADASGDARNALSRVRPVTAAGLRALIRFHAEDIAFLEPDTYGALALRDIAAAIDPHPPP